MEISKKVEKIYNLTPMQEGMLIHKYSDAKSTGYVVQTSLKIDGNMDMDAVRTSLWYLSQKHEMLRAAFIFPKSSVKPLQVILHERSPELNEMKVSDWRQVEEMKRQDVLRGFDMINDSLLRVTVMHISEEESVMVWSFHHIIMDGWCLSILFKDFINCYNSIKRGMDKEALIEKLHAQRNDVLPFSEYVSWLGRQGRSRANQYWDNLLDGYSEAAEIPSITNKSGAFESRIEAVVVDQELTQAIQRMTIEYHVTMSTVLESVWGILLQKYNRTDDITFGKVVSGRSAELPGIEQTIGLFINTIPVRVEANADTPV